MCSSSAGQANERLRNIVRCFWGQALSPVSWSKIVWFRFDHISVKPSSEICFHRRFIGDLFLFLFQATSTMMGHAFAASNSKARAANPDTRREASVTAISFALSNSRSLGYINTFGAHQTWTLLRSWAGSKYAAGSALSGRRRSSAAPMKSSTIAPKTDYRSQRQ